MQCKPKRNMDRKAIKQLLQFCREADWKRFVNGRFSACLYSCDKELPIETTECPDCKGQAATYASLLGKQL